MPNMLKKVCVITALFYSNCFSITPYYGIRSQGVNAARDLVGLTHQINLQKEVVYGTIYGLFEYGRSFHPNSISQCLFGSDLTCDRCFGPSIGISGSRSPDRAPTDWLADYFGLPTDYKSSVSFKPLIQNYVIDFGFYMGLDEWAPGLYFKVHAPITHTRWSLQFKETTTDAGSSGYAPGYFNGYESTTPTTVGVSRGNLVTNFTAFITGAQTPVFEQSSAATFPAGIFEQLANARLSASSLEHTGLAELTGVVGWNWVRDTYHVGFNLRAAAPTGNKPKGQFVFEPIVGNGHHWEFGGGVTSHVDLWCCPETESTLGLYIDANITHLFKARQRRTFDLKGKPNSRYMLAQKLGTSSLNPRLNTTFPNLEFQSEFSPVANLTTMDVQVSIAAQADMVALLNFTRGSYSLDVGYNFWAISCEEITQKGCPSPLDDGITWALKGDAAVIGFSNNSPNPVRLAATESAATIHSGTNFPANGNATASEIIAARANPRIDSPAAAVTTTPATVNINPNAVLSVTNPQINSSTSPIFITINDVDFVGNRGLSQKLFAHFSYNWLDHASWNPYLGIGGEVEWGHPGKNSCGSCSTACVSSCSSSCNSTCNRCEKCAVSQWGIWIKGGVSF